MQTAKPIVSCAIALILASALTVTAFAYTYIDTVGSTLTISSSGTVTSTGSVRAIRATGNATMTTNLQQYKNGTWITLKTWTKTDVAKYSVCVSTTYTVAKGYKYRLITNAKVYNSADSLVETASLTSPEKTY